MVFFRIVRYTFFMPEQYSPDRPEPKELRTSNDDFLDDLGERFENNPLTPKEQTELRDANRIRASLAEDRPKPGAESFEQTMDKIDLRMGKFVEEGQWKKLDEDSQGLFKETRALFQTIGDQIRTRPESESLKSLRIRARACYDELAGSFEIYSAGQSQPTEFIDELNKAFDTLQEIAAEVDHLQDR